MTTLKCGIHFSLQTLVVTKFLTGSWITAYISSIMALLPELVESSVTIAPPQHLPLWEQLVSKSILETSRAYGINHKICYQPIITSAARWRRNGVDWSCFTNKVESKMDHLPDELKLSLCISMIFSSLLQQSMLGKQTRARNPNLGWLNICKPKSVLEIASIRLSTKSDRSGSILAWRH